MTALEKINAFLSKAPKISLGYREINFFSADNLDEEQVGYSFDTDHNSLISAREGSWKEDWLAIGTDDLGDPIIVDAGHSDMPVMTAMHGEGEWEPWLIAQSLEKFKKIIFELKKLSQKRTNPVDLEKNPISEKEREQFIKEIQEANPKIDIDYWDSILEDK